MASRPNEDESPSFEDGLCQAGKLLHQARGLSQRIAIFGKRVVSEGDALADEVATVTRAIQKENEQAGRCLPQDDSWVEVMKELEVARSVVNGNGPGGDLRVYTRTRKPSIIIWMLGGSTNVVSFRKDQSMKLKESYHKFRTRCAYVMLVFALSLHLGLVRARARTELGENFTLTPVIIVGIQLYLCWLLFFYTASALRESVLKMNGSHIRPWWIHHHYWSMGTCCLVLSLPVDSPSFVRTSNMFLWWSILQGVVMIMQNRYQRNRMYTRVALGKNTAMDVISGETSAPGQLLLLYPALFGLQGLQLYMGFEMIRETYWAMLTWEGILDPEGTGTDLWGSRGMFLVGCLLIYMALMNFSHTFTTITGKLRSKERTIARMTAMRAHSVRSNPTSPTRGDSVANWAQPPSPTAPLPAAAPPAPATDGAADKKGA